MKRLINLEMAAELPKEESKTDIIGMIILDHKGTIIIAWDIFIGLLCIVSAYFYAYTSLFGIGISISNIKQGDVSERERSQSKQITDLTFFVIFSLDIMKNFLTDF